MARENSEIQKGATTCEDVKVEFPPAGIKVEDQRREGLAVHSLLKTSPEIGAVEGSISGTLSTGASKWTSSKVQSNDGLDTVKVEGALEEKKPRTSGNEGVSLKELSGYNSKRRDFEVEYDNDAELLLADMKFMETVTNAARELKLGVLHIYSKRKLELLVAEHLLRPRDILNGKG